MNKEQTEKLIDVIYSGILLGLSLTSIYFFINGTWFSIMPNVGLAMFAMFIIGIGTFFGTLFGVICTVLTIYSLNDARTERKEVSK